MSPRELPNVARGTRDLRTWESGERTTFVRRNCRIGSD